MRTRTILRDQPKPPISTEEDRRSQIKAELIKNAATGVSQDSCSDGNSLLFSRPGITGSKELRGEILRLAAEYVDMLMLQDEVRAIKQHNTPTFLNMPAQIEKELVTWTVHVIEALKNFQHELITYADWCDKWRNSHISVHRSEKELAKMGSQRLMAGIIKLALVTKHAMNDIDTKQGDIPPEWEKANILSRVKGITSHQIDENKLKAQVNDELRMICKAAKERVTDLKAQRSLQKRRNGVDT